MLSKCLQKLWGYLIFSLAVISFLGNVNTANASANTYLFSDMSYDSSWGVSSYSITQGALKANFNSLYGEVKYKLPTTYKASDLASITVNANTAGENVAFKFYDSSGTQLFVSYNNNASSQTDFTITPSGSGTIAMIGVMSQSSNTFTSTTYNVVFDTADSTMSAHYFSGLNYDSSWGVSSYSISQGALKANFNTLYGEVKYTLPTTYKASDLSSITIGANTAGENTSFKFYDSSGNQLFVSYNNKSSSYTDFTITPSGSGTIASIGVMSQSSNAFTCTAYNVVFLKSGATTASSLKSAIAPIFEKCGAGVLMSELRNSTTFTHIKSEYNSITIGNEMKPDYTLGSSPTLISTTTASANGYIIPSGYTESTVPQINYSDIDETLQKAYQNGLSVRIHTLVWHRQTPSWFFKQNYSNSNGYVSSSIMDKRLEYYVKNVVSHISASPYKSVVYAYDVVNEYFHNTDQGGTSNWTSIYGEQGTTPSYVKNAFTYAAEVLSSYGLRNNIKLFYNDYNTYLVSDEIISLINYVNTSSKLCDGIGMQCHLDVSFPSVTLIGTTIDKFKNAGFEIQITELDVTLGSSTLTEQANYYYYLMKMLQAKKAAGANITSITFWGLCDADSWRASGSPLLYSTIGVKKAAYFSVLSAFSD